MEFSGKGRRNTLFFALFTLLIIALTLVASTWQTLRQQENVSLQHMAMGARSIAQAVDSSYRRQGGHHDFAMKEQSDFWPRLEELFTDVETSGDVQFIEIVDERGLRVLASRQQNPNFKYVLKHDELAEVLAKGEWFNVVQADGKPVFVYAYKVRVPGMGMGKGRAANERFTVIIVGTGLERQLGMYERFRQNAFMQSLYILAAAVFVWALALSLISRRSLVYKARYLERFQAELLDNMPDGLITIGDDGFVQSANPMAHELLSFKKGNLVGKKLSELPVSLKIMARQPEADEHSDDILGWEQAEIGGKQLEILTSGFKGEHEQTVILLLIRNRTRVHNLERSLAEAEKMAAVGTLAAGVAHEIRNPLAALRGFAQYFAKKFSGKQPDEEFANTMVREADRLNRVITDLLYLARNKGVNYDEVFIGDVASDVESLLRFDLEEKNVMLSRSFELESVWADADSLKQAVLNLMLNSLDAIAERRERDEPDWQPEISLRSYVKDNWAVLEVKDNGIGMDAGQKFKAFEAFFTNKTKGTGLGLALVHKTLHEHGGHALIESGLMEGCAISLYFPLTNYEENSTAKTAEVKDV